jgi:hypothetical protein
LINALSGNSFVKTVQHATIEEAVFSVDPTDAPIDWLDSDHVICVSCDGCLFHSYISKSSGRFRAITSYESVIAAQARKQASSKLEEYRRVQEVSL